MINSRSLKHPDWVQMAIKSIENQSIQSELIVIDNTDRKMTVGKCWNDAVKKASGKYCFFIGDDDWVNENYLSEILYYANNHPNYKSYHTNMTAFDEQSKRYTFLTRICTGAWRKDYLLKHPFDEQLIRGIDREYIQEMQKRGDVGYTINHHHGYYYRKHDDYSLAGEITFKEDNKTDIYVLTSGRNFIDPIVKRWKEDREVFVTSEQFNPLVADNAKIIFCEWLRQDAIAASKYDCKAKKILRLHAYEAFSPLIHYVDFSKFDTVIFIAQHIKEYVESKVGKLSNAVVIPVGVQLNGYDVTQKKKTNKIAYAGEISRKKGAGELMFIANSLPEYEFHIAGKFNEEDTAEFFNKNRPDNMYSYPYSYDLNAWLQDYTFFINTSLREGNPVTVWQAQAMGLKPLVRDWVGAKSIFGHNVYKDLDELRFLLEEPYEPQKYREAVSKRFNFEDSYDKISNLMEV